MKATSIVAVAAIGLFAAWPVLADNWDQIGGAVDDSSAAHTTTELVHGTVQIHDLDDTNSGLPDDEDWYFLSIKPFTSYEVIVDATTPFMNAGGNIVSLSLVQSDGTLDTSDYAISSKGFSRSLRVGNSTATVQDDRWVRVTAAAGCGGSCDPRDQYTIRMQETTLYVPRFNNSGTQTSILFLQNTRDVSVSGNLYFWAADGTLLNTTPISLSAKQTVVTNTSTIVPGVGGSITISHNSTYGSLAGKIVALEPATGFTFDTQLVSRAN